MKTTRKRTIHRRDVMLYPVEIWQQIVRYVATDPATLLSLRGASRFLRLIVDEEHVAHIACTSWGFRTRPSCFSSWRDMLLLYVYPSCVSSIQQYASVACVICGACPAAAQSTNWFPTSNATMTPANEAYYAYGVFHQATDLRVALFNGTQSGRVCNACLPLLRQHTSRLSKSRLRSGTDIYPTCGFCSYPYPEDELYIQVTRSGPSGGPGWERAQFQQSPMVTDRWPWSSKGKRWITQLDWKLCSRCIAWLRQGDRSSLVLT